MGLRWDYDHGPRERGYASSGPSLNPRVASTFDRVYGRTIMSPSVFLGLWLSHCTGHHYEPRYTAKSCITY